jgi:hypothetical protein
MMFSRTITKPKVMIIDEAVRSLLRAERGLNRTLCDITPRKKNKGTIINNDMRGSIDKRRRPQ